MDVDVERSRCDPDLLGTARLEEILPQLAPQEVQRLTERVPGALLILGGPEDPQDRVPSYEAGRGCNGQVGQHGQSLRL